MPIIPRNGNSANNSNATTDRHEFNAQLAGICVVSADEVEVVKTSPTSVPTAFRSALVGDILLLSIDKNGYYKTPRLRVDNNFKSNAAFDFTPKFTLLDILENGTNEEGELTEQTQQFASKLIGEYKQGKRDGKKSIVAALIAKRQAQQK